ncbi:MAG: Smr/MutS family protein [Candidatus Protistobacter heckmanni]|nr:Smr/MutS family protein [Candidatus Protistobacter heckmanni]
MSRKPPGKASRTAGAGGLNSLSGLESLAQVRDTLKEQAQQRAEEAERARREERKREEESQAFRIAMGGMDDLRPLPGKHQRAEHPRTPPSSVPVQSLLDDKDVLRASMSDEFDVENLLDTDDSLSYCREGIGADVLRKLRRGNWVVQAELDLHGLRSDEARAAVALFLRNAVRAGRRCVRVIHGKGLGSPDKTPVLKNKVRAWLVQREEVLAFVQAPPTQGGAGALVVVLRPAGPR